MSHTVKIIDHDGQEHTLEATIGFSLMEIIRDAGLDIEAICGGCCACATCHCYVNDDWFSRLSPANDDEESMLDQAFDIKKIQDILSNTFTEELDGIVYSGSKF